MPLFQYKAYTKAGEETSGVVDADDLASARQAVKAEGLAPFEIEPAPDHDSIGFSRGFTLAEQARFSRQLAALLKGGVPLTRALAGIEVQQAWKNRRQTIVALREGIEKGRDISTVIAELETIFSPTLLAVIRVGETTGKLDFAFAQLAAHLDREMEHRRRLAAAIAYPAITAIISIGVLAFLMVYLVPTVARMFADVQGELPWITRWLIAFSNFFREYWLILGIGALILVVCAHFALKIDAFRRKWEKFEVSIPIWGRFSEGMRMESWARNTGMMIECGVTLLEAVRVLKENHSSLLQFEALDEVEKSLERGVSFSEALKASGFFPVFLIQMIEAGEASGELSPMLQAAATELEADNRVLTEMFLNVLEPLLIVVMGTVVGAIMIGVLLPIYEMNRFL
ncbi:MAG: ral secretion pathway protein [Clostridiales bacterium]|jgi:general secretion pathway protein F|nr:ral secretion pathway protein [Clostridiales bacterium]MDN5283666.1 ral secretion pathway protein [Candidatus Ozemobacter sp.]